MSSTTSCGVGTKMTSGYCVAGCFCACARSGTGAAKLHAAASAIRIFMGEIMPEGSLRRDAGGEPVRRDRGVELALLVGKEVERTVGERRLEVPGAVDLEARPSNQHDGGDDGGDREQGNDRMLVFGRLRELVVRAGDHGR